MRTSLTGVPSGLGVQGVGGGVQEGLLGDGAVLRRQVRRRLKRFN